jgi:thiopeptide-type bacteriocin biosynthesis protein
MPDRAPGRAQKRLRVRDGVLYARLYGGESALDKVLREPLWELVEALGPRIGIKNWFFIRYYDPLPHLRLRIFADTKALLGTALPALEEMSERSSVSRLVFDSYEPETTRYGGAEGIGIAEQIFGIDSAYTIKLLRAYMKQAPLDKGEQSELVYGVEQRWLLVAQSVCYLLRDLGLEPEKQLSFLEGYVAMAFGDEAVTGERKKAIGLLFRHFRTRLDTIGSRGTGLFEPAVDDLFAARSAAIAPSFKRLADHHTEGRLVSSLASIHGSILHMHCNRMFISYQRRQEGVLLPIIVKALRSANARKAAEPSRRAAR